MNTVEGVYNEGYVSVFQIINKVLRDLGMEDSEKYNEIDLVNWAAEAQELIGTYRYLFDKQCFITADDYIARLPCDFYSLVRIEKEGEPLQYNGTNVKIPNDEYFKYKGQGNPNDQLVLISGAGFNRNSMSMRIPYVNYQWTYYIENGIVYTNIREGDIFLCYKAIPSDENGYPMVRNTIKHRAAVAYYIIWKMKYIDMLNGKLNMQIYNSVRAEWIMAARDARATDMLPDNAHERDYIRSIHNRMINWATGHRKNYENVSMDNFTHSNPDIRNKYTI